MEYFFHGGKHQVVVVNRELRADKSLRGSSGLFKGRQLYKSNKNTMKAKNQYDKCLNLLIRYLIVIQTNHNFETFHHKKICKNYLKWVNGNKNLVCMAVRSSRNTRKILVQTKSSFLWTHLCTFKRSWEATSTSKGKGPTFEERHEWRGRKVRQFSK